MEIQISLILNQDPCIFLVVPILLYYVGKNGLVFSLNRPIAFNCAFFNLLSPRTFFGSARTIHDANTHTKYNSRYENRFFWLESKYA